MDGWKEPTRRMSLDLPNGRACGGADLVALDLMRDFCGWLHRTAPEVITMPRTRTYLGLGLILALMLSACAAGPNELVDTGPDPAGFWLGLWQGFISPITFLISLFTSEVNIYEVQNNGNWYDFGFMLGVATAFGGGAGGGSASAGRVRRRRRASGS